MKNFLCPLIALFLTACTPSDTWLRHTECLITGTIPGDAPEEVLLSLPGTRFEYSTKIPVREGRFEYLLRTDTLRIYELLVPTGTGSFLCTRFIPEPEGVRIECTGSDPDNRQLRLLAQGPINREWTKTLREKEQRFDARFDSIIDIEDRLYRENRLYNDTYNEVIRRLNEPADQHALPYLYKQLNHMRLTGSGYTDEGQRLHQTLQTLYEEQAVWLQEQIARRPSLASFCRLMEQIDQEQMAGRDFSRWLAIYDRAFADRYPAHPYHEQVEHARKSLKTGIGGRYIDFTLPATEGRPTTLSAVIDGKIALLDLWASWCRPCRLRSRNTIPIYEKYRSRGFVVVGVAREFKNDKAWRTALEHDAYPWLNLLEMDDSTKLWEQYGLNSAAGQTYLIDRDGTILAINPMADELERLLREKL